MSHNRISKDGIDLPLRTKKELSSWGVQSVHRNVEDTAPFNSANFVDLVACLGHVVNIDGLLEVISNLYNTTERDGSKAKVVADVSNDANFFFFFLRSLSGRQVPSAGTAYWNPMNVRHLRYLDLEYPLTFIFLLAKNGASTDLWLYFEAYLFVRLQSLNQINKVDKFVVTKNLIDLTTSLGFEADGSSTMKSPFTRSSTTTLSSWLWAT